MRALHWDVSAKGVFMFHPTGQATYLTTLQLSTGKPLADQEAHPARKEMSATVAAAVVGGMGLWLTAIAPSWGTPASTGGAKAVESPAHPSLKPEKKSERVQSPSQTLPKPPSLRRSPLQVPVAMPTYVPPRDQVPPRTRGWTAGRRGCVWTANQEAPATQTSIQPIGSGSGEQRLTPLAPLHHLGKTAQTHPTFVWFGEHGDGAPIEFSLYAYNAARGTLAPVPIYQKSLLTAAGTNAFTLPTAVPPLQPGQTYVWQVVLQPECNANNVNPARNPWLRTAFQVVSPQPTLSVAQMAAQGLWYDALGAAWQLGSSTQFASLLQQLADLEAQQEPPEQPLTTRLSYALRRIATYPMPEVRAAIAPF